jgi:hypothetical protein
MGIGREEVFELLEKGVSLSDARKILGVERTRSGSTTNRELTEAVL